MGRKAAAVMMSLILSLAQVSAGFAAPAGGPGVLNLAPSDPYSNYQWGLMNDGGLSLNISGLKRESLEELYQSYRDWYGSGQLGIPPRNPEPGDYESHSLRAKAGIDINAAEGFTLYRKKDADGSGQTRRDTIVAIIDTGVDTEHPELQQALWTNAGEIPDDGIDNDGNGYIDDVHGYNFFDHNAKIRDNAQSDLHGTHAAGTIGAAYGNGGITGITDNGHVKLMILKALGGDGTGSEESVIEAIRYAQANGADICNLSLGTTKYMPRLEQQIANSPMLFVVAAGNGDELGIGYDTDQKPVYPADYASDNIISVANLMFDGNLDISSNYGVESVDIAAPGSYILSTAPGGSFEFLTGTSMAAPVVTGICAMVYSYRPELGILGVKEAVLNSARKLDSLNGKVKCGGIPDLYAAMRYGMEAEAGGDQNE